MSLLSKRARWAVLLLPLLLIAVVACKSDATTTPTPVPTPVPILAGPDAGIRELFQAIPVEEQQCVAQALGQTHLDELLEKADTSEVDDLALQQCLSQETFARITAGVLISEVGSLSDETMNCVWSTLEGVDLTPPANGEEMNIAPFAAFLKTAQCLNEEEVARADATGGAAGLPIAGMRCLAENLDQDDLASLFASGVEGALPPPDVLAAVMGCGVEMGGPEVESSGFNPEQFTCLQDAVGDEALAQIFVQGGGETLSPELTAAMTACGMPLVGGGGTVESPIGN
ncbi:MAG: hypothetical protein HW388_1464 [Dehalococcoidia bacterium]|nr:hypothetical protein [Dehalococcoidia bacterium]